VKQAESRRPSLPVPAMPHGLWSLWDMLSNWGYVYFHLGQGLGYAELDLQKYRKGNSAGAVPIPSAIEPNNPIITALYGHLCTVLGMVEHQDLGTLPRDIEALKGKIDVARKRHSLFDPHELPIGEILKDVQKLQNDFRYLLEKRKFYSIAPMLLPKYANSHLFGPVVAKKFPQAQGDIEAAGNCLVLGEPTACVLHLNRAMEIATRRLAKKLNITPDAKDSWGMVLGRMTDPIKQMKDNKPAEKRKKEKWSECRANLYYVKMAWRDPGAHGTESYSDKEATKILGKVEDFMQQLATLL
jgi:hypothetical protein